MWESSRASEQVRVVKNGRFHLKAADKGVVTQSQQAPRTTQVEFPWQVGFMEPPDLEMAEPSKHSHCFASPVQICLTLMHEMQHGDRQISFETGLSPAPGAGSCGSHLQIWCNGDPQKLATGAGDRPVSNEICLSPCCISRKGLQQICLSENADLGCQDLQDWHDFGSGSGFQVVSWLHVQEVARHNRRFQMKSADLDDSSTRYYV